MKCTQEYGIFMDGQTDYTDDDTVVFGISAIRVIRGQTPEIPRCRYKRLLDETENLRTVDGCNSPASTISPP